MSLTYKSDEIEKVIKNGCEYVKYKITFSNNCDKDLVVEKSDLSFFFNDKRISSILINQASMQNAPLSLKSFTLPSGKSKTGYSFVELPAD